MVLLYVYIKQMAGYKRDNLYMASTVSYVQENINDLLRNMLFPCLPTFVSNMTDEV